MYDNGLLKYYKDYADKQGRLKTYEALKDCSSIDKSSAIKVYYTKNGELSKKYFEKLCGFRGKNAECAEIMQSQVFKEKGLNTTIYTPSIGKDGFSRVISDDITTATSNKMGNVLNGFLLDGIINYSPYFSLYTN